jgi:hypothetical protein
VIHPSSKQYSSHEVSKAFVFKQIHCEEITDKTLAASTSLEAGTLGHVRLKTVGEFGSALDP